MVDSARERATEANDASQKLGSDAIDRGDDGVYQSQDGLTGLLGNAEIAELTNASQTQPDEAEEGGGLLDKLKEKVMDVIGKDDKA